MKKMSWVDAEKYVSHYNELNKIIFVLFTDPNCDACKQIKDSIDGLEDEDFEIIEVDDGKTMTFPMVSLPASYIFIPGIPTQMPLIKVGVAPSDILKNDIDMQKEAFRTQTDYYEVVNKCSKPQM
jgi:thiol-disulfide isomerase/thioredoxin